MPHAADKETARRLLKGSERDFEAFFNEYFPKVYRFCARRLSGPDLEDIALSVMRQTFRRLETFRGEASLFTWICQIARGEVAAYYKKRDRKPQLLAIDDREDIRSELESIPADPAHRPDNSLAGDQRRQAIQALLDHLPGNYGQVLEAKYVEGLSMREIAERLDTTPKAVESILSRARLAFKEHFAAIDHELKEIVVPFRREET